MKLFVFTVLFLLTFMGPVDAQVAGGIGSAFHRYRVDNLQEKLYVHTDREFYLCGEIIWFKVYNHDGIYLRPLDMSRVAYLEVLDEENKPALQAKVELVDGTGSGSLFIPTTLSAGVYRLRAYTRWMQNFSPDFYFQKEITIVNTFRSLGVASAEMEAVPDIQFFPEGGQMVEGLESKVAFRGVKPNGLGFDFEGAVVNQTGDTVVHFESGKFGMGHFYLIPQKEQHYKAVIKDKKGKRHTYNLPPASDGGVVMHLAEQEEAIKIQLKAANFYAKELIVFVHLRNRILSEERVILDSGKTSFSLKKEVLGEGIHHITVFDAGLTPLCERLYFRKPARRLALKGGPVAAKFETREKVTVQLESYRSGGSATAANLSAAVYHLDSLNGMPDSDIQSYLWLASDLVGKVESPGYYFSAAASDAEADILMLTHGWRRFTWQRVLQPAETEKPFFPEIGSHIVEAKVVEKNTGRPAAGVSALLSSPGRFINISAAMSDSSGALVFEAPNLYGPGEVFLRPANGADSLYQFEIQSPFSEHYSRSPLPFMAAPVAWKDPLLQRSIHMQAQNVYRQDEINRFEVRRDSMSFFHTADKTYYLDDYTRFTIMEDVMREYVPEVWVRQRKKSFYFRMLDSQRELLFGDDNPMIFYDGVPVYNVDKLMAVDPLKVEKMEIITRKYFVGPLTFNGVVSYTTYRGNLDGFEMDEDAHVVSYDGVQLQREFYQPRYETSEAITGRTPDYRNLLFWSPEVVTGADGKANLEFYTSDLTGDFLIVVEGATKEGLVGSKTFTFSVEKRVK